MPKPVVLCILDGWGLRDESAANAVALAKTPVFDGLMARYPATTLTAHGPDVGLPEGQMGNSEVGHMNIGAGRVVWMDLPKINNAIADGSFAKREALVDFIKAMQASGGTAHVAGLFSDGGVHAHQAHIAATVAALTEAGVPVALHLFTDGRDVAPKSAETYLAALDLPEGARIATVSGRFFAMDRDNRWERVESAYRVMAEAKGERADSAEAAVAAAYARDETDEFVAPTVIGDYDGMKPGDGLFFANFRADRAREILAALLDPDFDGFARKKPEIGATLGMVAYSDALLPLIPALFVDQEIVNTLGAYVSAAGRTQFRLAETEKYPHVTFFLNGGVEQPYTGEERHMVPSPKVKTYDLQPEMSAAEVTEVLCRTIRGGAHDLIVVNYANPDMVGHTGDLDAAIVACEAVDAGVGAALEALEAAGGSMILTADHGNCDIMVDPKTGGPHTAHTLSAVPAIVIGAGDMTLRDGGRLADLAPTALALMGLAQPAEMTGESLIVGDSQGGGAA